jgi:hypothetical protein
MKKWLSKRNNQIVLFNATIVTIPLFFIDISFNTIILWFIALYFSYLFWKTHNDSNRVY